MVHRYFAPHPQLREVVNNIMINRIDFDPAQSRPVFPFPPLPEHCLFFYPFDRAEADYLATQKKEKLAASIIVGPQTDRLNLTLGHHHLVIKVGFQPGGLHRLLGVPMHELLRTEAFNATELLGSAIGQVNDHLREAASFDEMKTVVERFLLRHLHKLKERLPIDTVLPLMIREGGLVNVDALARNACLSNRQFERVFKDRMGLPPKFFSRLVRFSHAWVLKESAPRTPWIQVAHQCGYYDQMHLIRDFKQFTGTNPSAIEAALQQAPISLQNKVFY
jgi:AraC-like DNA-binding protein